jgi:S1-C subfamily serine protease
MESRQAGHVRTSLARVLARRSGWAPDGPRSGLVVVRCGGEACHELQSGDWIVTVGGTPVRDAIHLTELAQRVPPGKMASVGVVRAAKKVTLKVAGPELFVTEVLR